MLSRSLSLFSIAALLSACTAAAGAGDLGPERGGSEDASRPGRDAGGDNADDASDDTTTSEDSANGDDSGEPDDVGADDAAIEPGDAGAEGDVVPESDTGTPPVVRGGELGVDPTSIYLTFEVDGPDVTDRVSLRNIGDAPVTIESIRVAAGGDPGFLVFDNPAPGHVLEPGLEIVFSVLYDPTEVAEANAEVIVTHDAADAPMVIPVTAAAKPGGPIDEEPPCVRVQPTTVDFGTVVRGSGVPVERRVRIFNCGTSDIRVNRLDRGSVLFFPTPAAFQWTSDPLPMTIAAGAERWVTVTYEAGRAGFYQGAIDVRTNVTGSETVRVNLRATAEPPPIEDLDLHLVLEWDRPSGSDVDFHLLNTGGSLFTCDDCYFANMSPDWGVPGSILDDPFLDYDDLQGPGPENINVDELAPGTYTIVAHYYSDTGSGGDAGTGSPVDANARVKVYIGGVLRAEYGPQNLARTNVTWDVARLEWPSGTLTPLGRIYNNGSGGGCL